jgi:ankyrin repeat protein
MQGRSEIVEQLLAHGADITRKDEDGRTALFYALEVRAWTGQPAAGCRVAD